MPVYPGAHNRHRPHRALGLTPPDRFDDAATAAGVPDVHCQDLLGGLIHEYRVAA